METALTKEEYKRAYRELIQLTKLEMEKQRNNDFTKYGDFIYAPIILEDVVCLLYTEYLELFKAPLAQSLRDN